MLGSTFSQRPCGAGGRIYFASMGLISFYTHGLRRGLVSCAGSPLGSQVKSRARPGGAFNFLWIRSPSSA